MEEEEEKMMGNDDECDMNLPEVEGKSFEEQLRDFMDYLLLELLHHERLSNRFREEHLGWYALFHERLRDRVQESIRSLFQNQLDEVAEWKAHANSLHLKLEGKHRNGAS